MSQGKAPPGSMGVWGERRYLGKGGFPLNVLSTDHYVDGANGTPNPPVPRSGNPYINPETGLPYPPSSP